MDCIKFVSSSSSSSFVAETDPKEERFWWNENAKGPWGGEETREHKKAFGVKRRAKRERKTERDCFILKRNLG